MKIIFIILVMLSFVYSDEMQRIEAIVKDINELRGDYEKCQSELKVQKPTKISAKILTCQSAQNEALKYKKLYEKEKQKNIALQTKSYKQENAFPSLMMKKEYQTKAVEVEEIVSFKASSFRLKVDSIVYDSIDGNKIVEWQKNRTFTSNKKTKNWIKVTGYFVDRRWQRAKDEMWIKIAQVYKK